MYTIDYDKMKPAEGVAKEANGCHSNVGYAIPDTIAMNMVELIDSSWFIPKPSELNGNKLLLDEYANNHRVLDICCNSGILLYWFLQRFRTYLTRYAKTSFNNSEDELCEYIIKNLLYGVSINFTICRIIRSMLYNNRDVYGNIYNYDVLNATHHADSDEFEIRGSEVYIYDRSKGEKVPMKFDVVCGNPPYNDDMYLDFVMLGHRLAKTYDLWITPAKFVTTADDYRAKSNTSYKVFRECVLDKISDLCFYPDALDLFNISQVDGIAYYLVGKDSIQTCNIENKSLHNKQYNSYCVRDLVSSRVLFNKGYDLIKKLGKYDSFKPSSLDKDNLYKVIIGTQFVTNGCGSEERKRAKIGSKSNIFNLDGTITVVSRGSINTEVPSGAYCCAFSSNKEIECESFISWLNTRFMRFLVLCNISKLTGIYTDDYFKFVPNPGSFDKVYEDRPLEGYIPDENGIYTDGKGVVHCSLYVKYKLTQQEIDVIESVIRERV